MKKRIIHLAFGLLATHLFSNAQQITPVRGNSTVCSGTITKYTVTGTTSCGQGEDKTYAWTVTNGTFTFNQNVTSTTTTDPEVNVWWDDTTSDGVLTVRVKCDDDVEETVMEEYAIRSLKGRDPTNAQANFQLPYCNLNGNFLSVDEMILLNTGGATGIQLEYADGYEWDLPTGWTSGGSADGAVVSTSAPFLNIESANGCTGGTTTVRAYVSCGSGRKYSDKANISLARIQPNVNISFPPGYTGPGCGDTQPRTFTVTSLSCASSYSWIFPPGWSHSSFITSTNSIIVTPSGGASDAGPIQVNVNLDCDTVFNETRTLNVIQPTINSLNLFCESGRQVSINNVSSGVTVTWSVSNNLSIVSGQGTSIATIAAINNSSAESGFINANVSCPGVSVPQKNVWVGQPGIDNAEILDGGTVYQNSTYVFTAHRVDYADHYVWQAPFGWAVIPNGNGYTARITPTTTGPHTLFARAYNGCGYNYISTSLCVEGSGYFCDVSDPCVNDPFPCLPDDPIPLIVISPNPADSELDLTFKSLAEMDAYFSVHKEPLEVRLTNRTGETQATGRMTKKGLRLNVTSLKPGLYLVFIGNQQEQIQYRLVIE